MVIYGKYMMYERYPLVIQQFAIEHGLLIVDLPINKW